MLMENLLDPTHQVTAPSFTPPADLPCNDLFKPLMRSPVRLRERVLLRAARRVLRELPGLDTPWSGRDPARPIAL
jgi:hypothetical protein